MLTCLNRNVSEVSSESQSVGKRSSSQSNPEPSTSRGIVSKIYSQPTPSTSQKSASDEDEMDDMVTQGGENQKFIDTVEPLRAAFNRITSQKGYYF